LKLLLLAIESRNADGNGSHLSINPGSVVTVEFGTRGFFIAGSHDEIKRAFFYCESCHKDASSDSIKKCSCHNGNNLF
jgi:potassium large conductance calcium-activated channel subfamily M alpha member 1